MVRALLLCLLFPTITVATPSATFQDDFMRIVRRLASDEMEGRGIGTTGLAKATSFLEKELKVRGLPPAFPEGYRQSFPVKTGVTLLDGNKLGGVSNQDYTPLGFSATGSFTGELAFCGYGITAPAIGFDELAPLDLHGKVALMLRYEPQERDDASPFAGNKPSRYSSLRYRVHQAAKRGAVAVIFVTGPLQDQETDRLPVLRNDGPESPARIPSVQVKTSVAKRWLAPLGIDLEAFQRAVDRDLLPRGNDATGIEIDGKVNLLATYDQEANLVALVPGRGKLSSEVIVLGAHYDHLGFGGQGSRRPNVHAVHHGADDNASGTAMAILLADRLAKSVADSNDRRSLLLCLFSGEEVGLAGSSYLVTHPPVPIDGIKAMVNLDMVGRYRGKLVAFGARSAAEWNSELEEIATSETIALTERGDGYGPSDQTSFYIHGIPVVHFFTGAHQSYHTPDDVPSTLNPEGTEKVAHVVSDLLEDLLAGRLTPTYERASAAPSMAGDSRGYGSYLGTIPDYTSMEGETGGVLLSDVRPGGPADLAGIRGGDRIVKMAGSPIDNLHDMTFALQDHRPGETIGITVVRKGKRLSVKATLGDREALRKTAASRHKEKLNAPAHAATEQSPSSHATLARGPATQAATRPATQPASQPSSKAGAATQAAATSTRLHAASTKPDSAPGSYPEIAPFYRDRPGPDFVVGAGKPFAKSFQGEEHLSEIRQLTFGGENAEAYFSPDGKKLILQVTPRGASCDQEYILNLADGKMTRVSSGKGRTTCGYFDYPEADRIIYASTEADSPDCPKPPDRSQGYVWPIGEFDIYEALPDGTKTRRLTTTPGYDAEATWCHRGGKFVFTSVRDGDLDLYSMDEQGHVARLTRTLGYDGGAFYSPDCKEIVWRASRPTGAQAEEYRKLLARGLVRPHNLEIYIMKADGTGVRQLTQNGAANFCPTFDATGTDILYSSNAGSDPREFNLYRIPKEGGPAERLTTAPGFDGFPHASPDGHYLVFGSNRADPASHETNIFIARYRP